MQRFLTSFPGAVATVGLLALWFVGSQVQLAGFAPPTNTRSNMQVAISLIVLGAALYVILSKKYEADVQKWAYGAIGTVMGYWLPSA